MRLALDRTEVLRRRFRHCAARSLMILRPYKERKKTVGRQQVSSQMLLKAVQSISDDFPILKEARREVLEDFMDVRHAEQVLGWLGEDRLAVEEVFTDVPSPFSLNLITQGRSDLLRIEERAEFLKRMHDLVRAKLALRDGKG
jgi:ATP-dependent Lhr-like helicase